MRIELLSESFDPHAELARFAASGKGAGALASFVGYCRALSGDAAVERLELEHYPGFTEAEMARLTHNVVSRHGLIDALVLHRIGAIPAGEPIVLVAALSAHRAAAFEAVEALMDYFKTDAPIWKREITDKGAHWIEPSEKDRTRRAAREKQP